MPSMSILMKSARGRLSSSRSHLPDQNGVVGVIDLLADEFVVRALLQFQAAEAGRRKIVRIWNLQRAGLGRHRRVHGERIEAIVDGDVAGQRVINPLLRLDRDHRAPARHCGRPFDRVHADIGAAVDRDHAVTMVLAPQGQQFERNLDFAGIERGRVEDLKSHAIAAVGGDHAIIETIDNHRSMAGRGHDKGQLLPRDRH